MKIAENIKELRQEKGLTQKQPATHIGVSQNIDYRERGVNEPTANYILLLARFFDVSCDELLGNSKWLLQKKHMIYSSFSR